MDDGGTEQIFGTEVATSWVEVLSELGGQASKC